MQAIQANPVTKEQRATTDPIRKTVILQPLGKVLPSVSPIADLRASTNTLERGNRIYWAMYLVILGILLAAVVVGFAGYIGQF